MITNTNNEQFNNYKSLIPLNSTINWNDLYNTPFSKLFDKMEKTPQNPVYHGEGNVLSHVKLVCENLVNLDEYKKASYTDKFILFTSALLHDVGKIKRTKIDEDNIVSSGHSFYGSITAREFLYITNEPTSIFIILYSTIKNYICQIQNIISICYF
jgi:hypothetical protein